MESGNFSKRGIYEQAKKFGEGNAFDAALGDKSTQRFSFIIFCIKGS